MTGKPRHRRRAATTVRWVVILTTLLLIVALGGWGILRIVRPAVVVTEVVRGPVVQAFYSTGSIEPVREFPIRSNMEGTLIEVRVDKGDRVKKGDVIAAVTDPALVYALNRAQAELDEKLKRADVKTSPVLADYDARLSATLDLLEIAKREQQRVTRLLESNAGSQTDLDRAMDRLKAVWSDSESIKWQKQAKQLELQREVEVAQAAVDSAKWNVDQQTLRAPIDGVVLDRPTAVGTRVAINDRVTRIADVQPANLVMRAAVDEEDIIKVRQEQTVRMTLYSFPGQTFVGQVTRIYDQADVSRRTFEVDVKLREPNERLQPGMTGELAFIISSKDDAAVIPAQAVQNGAVWIVSDGQLQRLTPKVGITSVERVEIISGLPEGSSVVISPIGDAKQGQHVRASRLDPVMAAGLNKKNADEKPFNAFQ